ncbi:uncharacterized protein [Halyomorpha halys]|uniref:uncharacterized protein n=1 Tax=Halyomorpha halys TaxID=286706 RepID=UPI0034D1B394
MMKRLTGTKWGASQDVLSTVYKSYVRPNLEYGAELLISSSKAALEKLDKIQNQALRIITSGVKSTPITAMELQAGLEPLQDRKEKTALCLYEKHMRRKEHWFDYRKANERLRSHRTFLSKAEEMLHQIDLPTDERQNISISYMSKHDSAEVYGRLKLACGRIKKDCPEPELRAAALKTICELYPIEQWLHIYTDGSASGINKGAGAGLYSINFQLSFPIGAGCDNYDAEMQGICFAMEATIECNDNTVIFSDSQAVIHKLTTPGAAESPTEEKCRNMAAIMKKRERAIALQ